MKTVALSLVLASGCCFADEKPITQLMAYDFHACVDVVLSEVDGIAYIKSDDPSLMEARKHLGSPPNTNMLVGYDGALSTGRFGPDYRIYCIEYLHQRDPARRLQVICHQEANKKPVKITYKPASEFDGQNTCQCVSDCDRAPFKRIYEMSLAGEDGRELIPQQVKDIQRFRKCQVTR